VAREKRVAQHVHRLLLFTLDVDAAARELVAERTGQVPKATLRRDRLAGQRDIGDQRIQVAVAPGWRCVPRSGTG